jgi:hypothetical protein
MGYDKPINFREIVLRTYKNRCMWLRDTYFDRLDQYNYESWLPNIQYYYDALERERECLKKYQNELLLLTDETLQEMYAEKVESIKVLHNCNHSYHMDLAADISRCTDEYDKYLRKWLEIPNTPKWLTADLVDIYDCAMRDLREHNEEDIKSVERMHKEPIPTFENFKAETIARLEYNINFQKDRIESRKRNIKIVEKDMADVKQLFAWLDEIEKEN